MFILGGRIAAITELGCGTLRLVGLLTPLAAGGVLGTGEGYEYVLMISIVSVALAETASAAAAAASETTPP